MVSRNYLEVEEGQKRTDKATISGTAVLCEPPCFLAERIGILVRTNLTIACIQYLGYV